MKQLKGTARLIMYAGVSKPTPRLGQALGPLGMNMNQFCKEFNEKTNQFKGDVPMRVLLKAFQDRTYEYKIKPPPTSWYLKRLGGIQFGGHISGYRYYSSINIKYIYELAKIKKEFDPDMVDQPLLGIMKQIISQADSMCIYVDYETSEVLYNVTPNKF